MQASKTIVASLKAIRALIGKGWCRGAFARTISGRACSYDSPKAARFCLAGAMLRVNAPKKVRTLLMKATNPAGIGFDGLAGFNDRSTKAKVLALLDRVLAEQKGAK